MNVKNMNASFINRPFQIPTLNAKHPQSIIIIRHTAFIA